jgi:hypothetical protein
MTDLDDCQGDMSRDSTVDIEIERLLSGSPTYSDDLAPLAGVFASLHPKGGDELGEQAIARLVTACAAAAAAAPRHAAARPMKRSRLQSLRRRTVALAVAATVVVGGTSGLAFAADGAKPGDVLYGVDRAFETVGIGAGAEQERLSEVEALFDAGELERGLQHATEVLGDDLSDPAAADALVDAAARVQLAGSDESAISRQGVADLLDYITNNIDDLDGSQIADLASEIGRSDEPAQPGRDSSNSAPAPPSDTPADPPGLSEHNPGPPADNPAEPPGLSNQAPGPSHGAPADPPGHQGSAPGQSKKDR